MRRLIQKPKGVTYTQMAIWIDNHIYEPDCDYDTAYEYMYLLAYMLAAKHKYFNTQEEYEDFSTFLAYNVFQRYTADKYVNNGSKHLKSVLNYMKSILYFRKMAFNAQYRQKIIDPKFDNFDSDVYVEKQRAAYEASNREALVNGILDTFKRVPRMIKCCIPKVYCDDKSLEANLYMSSMLTIINRITLNNKCSTIFEEKANSSPKFDEVKYYSSHSTDNEVVA